MNQRLICHSSRTNAGFTLIELLIVVAVLAVLGSIAIPVYRNYINTSKQQVARSVLEQLPVLLESFRAENGQFPANGPYSYTEDNAGVPATTTLTAQLPDFKPKSSTQTGPVLYHYSMTVSGSGTATEAVTYTASPVVSRGGPPGDQTGSYN